MKLPKLNAREGCPFFSEPPSANRWRFDGFANRAATHFLVYLHNVHMSAEPTHRKPLPKDLKARGKALFRAITDQYVLDPAEVVLLHQLCCAVDTLDRLHADLAEMGVTVSGSTGQPRVNPVCLEIREQVKLVDRLQMALALPVADEKIGKRRHPQAKAAARTRVVKSRSRVVTVASNLLREDDVS